MLTRDTSNKMLGGVCSGLGKYMGIDALLVRLAFIFGFVWAGIGPLLYIILWLLIPADTEERK